MVSVADIVEVVRLHLGTWAMWIVGLFIVVLIAWYLLDGVEVEIY